MTQVYASKQAPVTVRFDKRGRHDDYLKLSSTFTKLVREGHKISSFRQVYQVSLLYRIRPPHVIDSQIIDLARYCIIDISDPR